MKNQRMPRTLTLGLGLAAGGLLALSSSACGDDEHGHEQELITTLVATLTSTSGASITARFSDPDGPGGEDPTLTQPTPLHAGTTYRMTLQFLNEAEDPAEDLTQEIEAEAEEHQIFFGGTATQSIVSIEYADKESDYTTNAVGEDLPVGLRSDLRALAAGSGTLLITLKHQPAVDGTPTKTPTSGVQDGETDVAVEFTLSAE